MGRRLLTRPEQLLQSVSPRQRELNAVSGVALAKEEEVKAEEIKRRLFCMSLARSLFSTPAIRSSFPRMDGLGDVKG